MMSFKSVAIVVALSAAAAVPPPAEDIFSAGQTVEIKSPAARRGPRLKTACRRAGGAGATGEIL